MVKTSSAPKMGSRTDPEAIERRRMQNRLAQRKRRLKRAQMAREEKERQQRLQAAQAASRITFMNEAYLPMGHPAPLYHEQKFPPVWNPFYTSTPPPFEDVFTSPPYIAPTPVPPFETDPSSFFISGYPSPSLSGYTPSTPPLSLYTPSLVEEDLSGSLGSNSNNVDPSMFLGSTVGVSSSPPNAGKSHALDAFGLVPLHTIPSPRVQSDRHRSTSLPTPFTPPRSVPSLPSPPPPQLNIARSQEPSVPGMIHRRDSYHKNNNCCNNLNMNANANSSNPNPSHASAHTHGKTGLHVCAEQGNTHVVQLLLGYGADIDSVDEYGCTPLHYAVRNNHPEVVKQLVERGARTTVADINGISPMHIAAESGSEEMMQIMMMMMMASPAPSTGASSNNAMTAATTASTTMSTTTALPPMMIPGQDMNLQAGIISNV